MSTWSDTETWELYKSKEGCPICNPGKYDPPSGEGHIADMRVSSLGAGTDTCMKGHCCLVARPHAIELYDLSEEDAAAFMLDIRDVARALQAVTGAVKINYEIHGNTIPHLHVHLWPRQVGDRFEGGPIDWRMKDPAVYGEGEFEEFIAAVREALGG